MCKIYGYLDHIDNVVNSYKKNQQPKTPYNNNQPRVNLKTYVYNPQIKASLLCVTLLK